MLLDLFLLCSFFGWSCFFPLSLCVVLLGFFLLWMVLLFSFTCLVVLLSSAFFGCGSVPSLSSDGWCCLVFSFLGWCCVAPLFFLWCCFPFHPLGSGAFLLNSVGCCFVSSSLWAVLLFQSPFRWFCLPSPCLVSFFFWWCCCFSLLFLSAAAFLRILWVGAAFPPSLLMGGAAWCSLFRGGVAVFTLCFC